MSNPIADQFEVDPTSRLHLQRFMKWLFSQHFSDTHQMASPESVIFNALNDMAFSSAHPNVASKNELSMIVDKYEEWLRLGEPA
jgi:hypothetical protein